MTEQIRDHIHAIRRATTQLEFALMVRHEEQPDMSTVNGYLSVIGNSVEAIANRLEGTD